MVETPCHHLNLVLGTYVMYEVFCTGPLLDLRRLSLWAMTLAFHELRNRGNALIINSFVLYVGPIDTDHSVSPADFDRLPYHSIRCKIFGFLWSACRVEHITRI